MFMPARMYSNEIYNRLSYWKFELASSLGVTNVSYHTVNIFTQGTRSAGRCLEAR